MSKIPAPRTEADRPSVPTSGSGAPGWFRARLDDVASAPTDGWHLTPTWIKATAVIAAGLAALLVLGAIADTLLTIARALPWPTPKNDPTGLIATIDQPVRHYLDANTTGLPTNATTVYATWQAVGALSFVLGYLRLTGARLTWVLWGATTTLMVWSGTPEPGRPVAAGLTLLAWAALSLIALHGLSLTPALHVDIHNPPAPAPQITAEIHVPTPGHAATHKPHDATPPFMN
ncbi:hypothetical protein AB4225_29205 [Streptomyces sp. 2RAF24]|uniref:hypothetical protein n=1 Tax=Streptomyces sp. 2RAF24 TaxID=3232997 RepID=UPI003F9BAABE